MHIMSKICAILCILWAEYVQIMSGICAYYERNMCILCVRNMYGMTHIQHVDVEDEEVEGEGQSHGQQQPDVALQKYKKRKLIKIQ